MIWTYWKYEYRKNAKNSAIGQNGRNKEKMKIMEKTH